MSGIRESSAQAQIEYQTDAATVAAVVQDVLGRIGKVAEVSRETGIISGRIYVNLGALSDFVPDSWKDHAKVIIRVSRKGTNTDVHIQATKGEALMTEGGAQSAVAIFTKALGEDKRLSGKSTSGW